MSRPQLQGACAKPCARTTLAWVGLLLFIALPGQSVAAQYAHSSLLPAVIINEVASDTAGDVCGGEDWVEIVNVGDVTVPDLSAIILTDDNGPDDSDAAHLPAISLAPGAYKLLCRDVDFDFGIGGDDTVSLYYNDTALVVLSTTGAMPDRAYKGITWARTPNAWGPFAYNANPSPGRANDAGYNDATGAATTAERRCYSVSVCDCAACGGQGYGWSTELYRCVPGATTTDAELQHGFCGQDTLRISLAGSHVTTSASTTAAFSTPSTNSRRWWKLLTSPFPADSRVALVRLTPVISVCRLQ
jgi:hypothetical protein